MKIKVRRTNWDGQAWMAVDEHYNVTEVFYDETKWRFHIKAKLDGGWVEYEGEGESFESALKDLVFVIRFRE